MAFTMITITETCKDSQGNVLGGTVEFRLTDPIADQAGNVYYPVPITLTLDQNGAFSTSLAANNDPTTQPTGTGYRVTHRLTGIPPFTYDITVPYNQAGGTLDLSKVTAAVLSSPVTTYATLTDTNRLATYDISGMAQGTIGAGAVVLRFVSVRAWALGNGLAGSQGTCGTNPTALATFVVNKNGVQVGTMSIQTSGQFVFTGNANIALAIGDVLTVVAPNPADVTLADVAFTLLGNAL